MNRFAKGALVGLTLIAAGAVPSIANAANAYATGDVNMRTGPGVGYSRILVVPAGAPIDVFACTGNWCQASYNGCQGWVSASYLASGYQAQIYIAPPPSPPPMMPMMMYQPPALQFEFNFSTGNDHPPHPPVWNGYPWPWH